MRENRCYYKKAIQRNQEERWMRVAKTFSKAVSLDNRIKVDTVTHCTERSSNESFYHK